MGIIEALTNSQSSTLTIDEIENKLLSYGFPGISILRKTSKEHKNYHHNIANIKGQIYEAYIYETLYNWVKDNNRISKFVLKGPYVKSEKISTGFGYDHNRLVYFSFDEQLAEFDGLFFFDNKPVFIEITTSTSGSIIVRKFVDDIKKKAKLLKELLNEDDVYSLVITPKKINSPRFKKLKNCINWIIPNLRKIDSFIPRTKKKNQFIQPDENSKYIKADKLKIIDLKVNKRRKLLYRKFIDLANYEISKNDFLQELSLHWWCVSRIYLGSIQKERISDLFSSNLVNNDNLHVKNDEIKRAVIGVKFQLNRKPNIELYFIPQKDYKTKFVTLQWSENEFKKRRPVIKKSTILRIINPIINPNEKQFWKKITNLCDNLNIPEFEY